MESDLDLQHSIDRAVALLNSGEVVAIPTETVYGLGASINSPEAIEYIFELKGRPRTNPLIVHAANLEQAKSLFSNFPAELEVLANQFWPGSLTLVLPKSNKVSDQITAGKNTVGIRVPNHPILLKVLEQTGPIAAPSANPFERISPTTAQHVSNYFPKGLKMVLDGGPCQAGIESTIVGYENSRITVYRLGAISIEQIETLVGKVALHDGTKSKVVTPGMSKKHYAPQTKTIVTKNITEFIDKHPNAKIGTINFQHISASNAFIQLVLSTSGDLKEAATNIYQFLHKLDELKLDYIVIEPLPDVELGRSVNERLSRAVHL